MPNRKRPSKPAPPAEAGRHPKDLGSWKPGSDPESAGSVAGQGDFGVPAGTPRPRDRQYVSENTRRSDPGASGPAASEHEGVRTSGAGARAGGDGAGSGGDLDADFIGVGTGGSGIATSGKLNRPPGPDDSDGSSSEFASGPPSPTPEAGQRRDRPAGPPLKPGDVAARDLDMQTGPPGEGADAATNPARHDDSFAGEVSSGEALGDDEPVPPSGDDQAG